MAEIIEGKPYLPPGMCFICEESNPIRYIDTFRDFEGVVREKLDGRKYVCEGCVDTFAKKFGYITGVDAEAKQQALAAQQKTIDELVKQLDAFKQLEAAIGFLNERPKTPAKKKPAAASV